MKIKDCNSISTGKYFFWTLTLLYNYYCDELNNYCRIVFPGITSAQINKTTENI